MRSISEEELIDMFRFVEQQVVFILETTSEVDNYHVFLSSQSGMVLFNSTCMCLQTIDETIRKIDNRTNSDFLVRFPEIEWKRIIGMRNIISHEYLSVDPVLVFDILRKELIPLLCTVRHILNFYRSTSTTTGLSSDS